MPTEPTPKRVRKTDGRKNYAQSWDALRVYVETKLEVLNEVMTSGNPDHTQGQKSALEGVLAKMDGAK